METGNPKPITYTHQMLAMFDVAASLHDIKESQIHQYVKRRWYTPLPTLHVSQPCPQIEPFHALTQPVCRHAHDSCHDILLSYDSSYWTL